MQNYKSILIELHYLPCLEVFTLFQQAEHIVFEAKEHFVKQTYRNRSYILSSNGIMPLIVPISHKHKNSEIEKLEIDYSQKWQNQHLRALESSYKKSPFYDHYIDRFLKVYNEKPVLLFDLNLKLLTICLDILNINVNIGKSEEYEHIPKNNEIINLRDIITPKVSFKERPFYSPTAYFQMFGKGFAPNLSVLDLIFSEGPNTLAIIKNSCK